MNFADERYVRLFTRDTATWKSWDWETRSIFTLMLRKVDRAGVIDTGKMPKPRAISLIIEAPEDVVARVLPLLVESEAIVFSETSVVMPKFLEAQESPQSDAQRQRESRQNRAAKALSQPVTPCHTVSQPVTDSHNLSLQTRPDQTVPSRAEPKKHLSSELDPRVLEVFGYWKERLKKGDTCQCTPKREKAVRGRLAEGYTVDQLKRAVDGCLATPHNMGQNDRGTPFNDLELICRDQSNVDRFMAAKGPQAARSGFDPNASISPENRWVPGMAEFSGDL